MNKQGNTEIWEMDYTYFNGTFYSNAIFTVVQKSFQLPGAAQGGDSSQKIS